MPNAPDMTHIIISEPGGPEVLRAVECERPGCGPQDLLVKVVAAGVNRPDIIQREGKYPMPAGVTHVPGLEIAGEVVAVGSDAHGFAVGDQVCGLTEGGGYAEYCKLPNGQALPIPAGLSMVEAAALPETFFTVWANLFEMGAAKRGDRVLIHGGTSGIGTTALMLCKEFGIDVFATAGSDKKCEAIQSLGARAINYRQASFKQVVLDETDQQGVDVVLDMVGASYFKDNVSVLARDGRLIIIGFLGGATVDGFALQQLVLKRGLITGSTMRARSAAEKASIAGALKENVWPALAAGRCKPLIYETFALRDVALAHKALDSGNHIGKVVLTVGA